MKKCSKCEVEKESIDFYKKKTMKDGLRSECKECSKLYQLENKDRIKQYQSNRYNNIKETESYKIMKKSYNERNKEQMYEFNKKYREKNKETLSEQKKLYYEQNKEEILVKRKEYYESMTSNEDFRKVLRERTRINTKSYRDRNKEMLSQKIKDKKKSDPLFRLSDSIRTLIWISINKMGYKKNSKTSNILGCSFEEFKSYIESQFNDNMTWENYGEWHLDHKTPVSWAETEEQVYELNKYTNFQPLWEFDNLSKGNKWSD
jgi:hypothetical protein